MFQIKLFQSTGLLTICYPYVSLEPIINAVGPDWIDATKRTRADRSTNVHNVKKVDAQWRRAASLQLKLRTSCSCR